MRSLLLVLTACLAAPQEKGRWVDISESVTSKVPQKWPFLAAGIAVDPASGEVYLVIAGAGLWKSTDHGATFTQVDDGKVGGRCETGASISVDPMGGGRLAFFQLDGKAAWTGDGGKTWNPCSDGGRRGFDFVAVDWSDPKARRMWGVRHESGDVGLLSEDGGASWKALDKGFKNCGVFDFNTLVTNKGQGIERSTDGGVTWTKVSDVVPTGRIMSCYKGVGYWLTEKGLLSSKDKGATWAPQGGAVSAWFGPSFGKDEKHMVVFGKEGFLESTDAGGTWKVAAPPPAEKAMTDKWFSNAAWDPKANLFYISRMGKPAFRYER
ncbi:MAG: hypothetical protein HY293_09915 [Planctomycetes bacterium]|nr:hypothetical protein [Planctomycetota bacterium]